MPSVHQLPLGHWVTAFGKCSPTCFSRIRFHFTSHVQYKPLQVRLTLDWAAARLVLLEKAYVLFVHYLDPKSPTYVLDINQPSLPTPSTLFLRLFLSYGPFTFISFHKFSRQLSVLSLCSPRLISASLERFKICFMNN